MPRLSRATLVDGRAHVLVVVVGGLFVLQGSNNLDVAKILYLLCAAGAVVLALASVPWWLSDTRSAMARPWILSTCAAAAILVLSVAVARAHGTQLTSWLRDGASYALFAAAPILALACARVASRRWLISLLVVCGALASISFAVEWIGRRQLATLPIDRIALPSEALAAALLAVATGIAMATIGRRLWWAAIGGAILGLFFITGSRSTLLLLVVPLGIAIFAGRPWRAASVVLVAEIAISVAVFLLGNSAISVANGNPSFGPWSGTATPSSQASAAPGTDRLGQRVSGLGTLLTDPGSDQSFQERVTQTKLGWDTFRGSPFLGVGPGYQFRWTTTSNIVVEAFTLDSPLVYLAKFGLVGLLVLALFVFSYVRLTRSLWRMGQTARLEFLAVVGFAIVLAVVGTHNFPFEDKGASFAAILVVALGLRAQRPADLTRVGLTDPVTSGIDIAAGSDVAG